MIELEEMYQGLSKAQLADELVKVEAEIAANNQARALINEEGLILQAHRAQILKLLGVNVLPVEIT
jgi:hypothetical protein